MRYCINCGHQLGIGRYCTNCGARIGTQSAVSPAPPAVLPYPPHPGASYSSAARRRSHLPWLLALLVVAIIAVVGGLLLLLGAFDDDGADGQTGPGAGSDPGERADDDSGGPGVIEPAMVTVPGTAAPSVDNGGNEVRYDAANMLDHDPRTCWRMPGDGTGSAVVLEFDDAVTVTEVGLINGYAKTDQPHDWYAGNRRITAVVWVFDDGNQVTQELVEDRTLQRVHVDEVETTTVELRIFTVSEPGTGADRRDFTAISEVSISGSGP